MLGRELPRRPGRVPAARRAAGGAPDLRAARRRRRLLVQQRLRRRHPRRGHRARLHRPRRGQGVHQGRHQLRLVPPAGQEAGHHRAGARRASTVSTALCEHFALSRAQLFDAVRVAGRLVVHARSSSGSAPAPTAAAATSASRPSRRSWRRRRPAHVLEGERAALQDTNDHVMANLQKDGSYSVVPRIPGGEVTPEGLIAIGAGRPGLRAVHQDHRRPADRPVRRPHRPAARSSGSGWSTPASSPATRTASRCAR